MVDECRPSKDFFGADPPCRSPGPGMCRAGLLNSPVLCFFSQVLHVTSFCFGAAAKTHLQLPAASTRVIFFPYGMDGKGEECQGPHPKLDIPVFPGMVHPLLSSQTAQLLFLNTIFPRGTTLVLTSAATAALGPVPTMVSKPVCQQEERKGKLGPPPPSQSMGQEENLTGSR